MQSRAGEGAEPGETGEEGAREGEGAWAKAQAARSGQDSWSQPQTGRRHGAPSLGRTEFSAPTVQGNPELGIPVTQGRASQILLGSHLENEPVCPRYTGSQLPRWP